MKILGIETSCDETSAAIVDEKGHIHAHIIHSQISPHTPHGGVVPEIAAREHLTLLPEILEQCMAKAAITYSELDGVAATAGPGLIGGVMVGMMSGKAIAAMHNIPFCAVNHLEGHALTPRLSDQIPFPYLLLLVSGGHTQLILVNALGDYETLGSSLDDAAGECFDKGAKLLGLGWPGGPALEKLAHQCTDVSQALKRFPMPRPLKGRKGCDFSFSGVKTALRTHVMALTNQGQIPLKKDDQIQLAAVLQHTICATLVDRTEQAMTTAPNMPFVVAGGVAANTLIRDRLQDLAKKNNRQYVAPPLTLCTDNAAMIAWVGIERIGGGQCHGLEHPARPRWPLDEISPPVASGA